MPQYDTPGPISVTLDLGAADLRVAASDRTDTVVEVRPGDDADESDVKAAQQVAVDFAGGVLQVTGPRRSLAFRKTNAVDVTIELPAGSRVSAQVTAGDFRATGRLGDSAFKTGAGKAWLERVGALNLRTGFGHITVGGIAGDTEISTGGGQIQIGEIAGTAAVKTSTGHVTIDAVSGDARVRTSAGDISIGQAGAGADVKTSSGKIRVGEVARGQAVIATSAGDLEVGIAEGTAAWLELHTGHGRVTNRLEDAAKPEESDETVEVHARTGFGDITIRRS
ncbi:MAG: DUF4097 domain-containing protein [Streptosporangiales bacterium]|nr:DUF4097 domain-containing protein [Streptosporangiales bacterium]